MTTCVRLGAAANTDTLSDSTRCGAQNLHGLKTVVSTRTKPPWLSLSVMIQPLESWSPSAVVMMFMTLANTSPSSVA